MKVIKFGAVWCSGCLVMRPRWQKLEKAYPWLKTVYYDYDQDQKAVAKYDIQGGRLPMFIFLDKKEKEILRLEGETSLKKLEKFILENREK